MKMDTNEIFNLWTGMYLFDLFRYLIPASLAFLILGFGIYTAEMAGVTLIYDDVHQYGITYMIMSFILTVVFHDFYFYWTHRFMHHKKIFKYVHRVHHESTNPSPWAAYSFHPWEALIQALVLPIMVFLFPLNPLVIF